MAERKSPDEISLQRISYGNVYRIEKLGKAERQESINDVLTRVLDECEEMKKISKEKDKEIKRLMDENKPRK